MSTTMTKPNTRGRTRRTGVIIAVVVLLVLAGVALTMLAVGGSGVFARVFAGGGKQQQGDQNGKVAVLISTVPIPAFTALDPAAFLDPKTGDFSVAWISEKTAQDAGFIRDPSLLRGRVLRHDKGASLAFSEADLFPRGTQPGLTGAIDPGYRGVSLNASEIEGLRALKRFDHFDIYAVKPKTSSNGANSSAYVAPEMIDAAQSVKEWQTDRLIIAQNAKILEPAPLAPNAKNPNDVYVAIRDEEATALADARAKGAKIFCWGRSGLPGGDSTTLEQPAAPQPVDTIQVITGDKSSTTAVPSGKSSETRPKTAPPEPK